MGHPNEVLISAATENFYYNGAQIWQQIVLYEAFKAAKQGMRGLLKLSLLKWKINSDSILTVAGPKDPPTIQPPHPITMSFVIFSSFNKFTISHLDGDFW